MDLTSEITLLTGCSAPLEESRKWAIYYIVNLLFKTYFKLNSASLSRTILTSLAAYEKKGDMPPLEAFPKSQRVTFKYYEGVLFFLEENYDQVRECSLKLVEWLRLILDRPNSGCMKRGGFAREARRPTLSVSSSTSSLAAC